MFFSLQMQLPLTLFTIILKPPRQDLLPNKVCKTLAVAYEQATKTAPDT